MNSCSICLTSVEVVPCNVNHIVSVIVNPARFTPAGLINVNGACNTSTPSSVATCIVPDNSTFIWSCLCILPTSTVPAGIVTCLPYTPPAKKSTTGTFTCGCSLQDASSCNSRLLSSVVAI